MDKPSKNIDFVDRRQFPRFKVHYLTDIYKGDRNIYATVIDISEYGIGIILPERFYPGDEIELRIRCKVEQDDETKTDIKMEAKVVWMGDKDEKGMFKGGLEITEISEQDLAILKGNIQELAEKQL